MSTIICDCFINEGGGEKAQRVSDTWKRGQVALGMLLVGFFPFTLQIPATLLFISSSWNWIHHTLHFYGTLSSLVHAAFVCLFVCLLAYLKYKKH